MGIVGKYYHPWIDFPTNKIPFEYCLQDLCLKAVDSHLNPRKSAISFERLHVIIQENHAQCKRDWKVEILQNAVSEVFKLCTLSTLNDVFDEGFTTSFFSYIGCLLFRDLMVGLHICSCTTFASVSGCMDNTKSVVSHLPSVRDLGDVVHTIDLSQTGELNQQCDLMSHLLGIGKSWGFTSGWIKVPTPDLVNSKTFLFNQLM